MGEHDGQRPDAAGAAGDGDPTAADSEHHHRHRSIYLLPNLITTAALFAGFFAIVSAMDGNYSAASLAIFAAMVLDTMDGRVARMTHTESAFGAEYDSLSDMVAFGIAPALVSFTWALSVLGKIGWVVTFIYIACAALRLARFNTVQDQSSFTGLPSPSAAALVAGTVWVLADTGVLPGSVPAAWLLAVVTGGTGLLMVANVEYFSPKMLNMKGRVPFFIMVLVVLAFALVLVDPPLVLLALFAGYALSGPAKWLWTWWRGRSAD